MKLCKQQLDLLGPSRATRDEQYRFLLELATQYQSVTSLALKAHYGGDDVFESTPSLKLATAIVDRNTTFSDDIWLRGHAMPFHKDMDAKENHPTPSPFAFGMKDIAPKSTNPMLKVPTNTIDVKIVRYEKNHADLEDIMHENLQILPPKIFGIKAWLESVYRNSRGFELGTFDASLLPIIWKKQSANWEALALGYVDDIVSLVHSFTVNLLAKICKDPRARQGLHAVLLDHLIERYKKSIDHTKFLLNIERSGTPMTMNHYFADNLQKR